MKLLPGQPGQPGQTGQTGQTGQAGQAGQAGKARLVGQAVQLMYQMLSPFVNLWPL
jgi:hypothetical protein